MQLAMCFVLLVASALAGAFTCDGSSLQLRSQHSLDSSLRSKAFGRVLSSKDEKCDKNQQGESCTLDSDCCPVSLVTVECNNQNLEGILRCGVSPHQGIF